MQVCVRVNLCGYAPEAYWALLQIQVLFMNTVESCDALDINISLINAKLYTIRRYLLELTFIY